MNGRHGESSQRAHRFRQPMKLFSMTSVNDGGEHAWPRGGRVAQALFTAATKARPCRSADQAGRRQSPTFTDVEPTSPRFQYPARACPQRSPQTVA